jgi:hypothetical protein
MDTRDWEVDAMPGVRYPIEMAGGVPVLQVPEGLDSTLAAEPHAGDG